MTKQVTTIQQATICRCTDKATHEVFYVIQSDSQEGTWYTIRFNQQALRWECNCKATKPCKHERAVAESLRERRARIASQMGGEVPAIVERMQAEEDAKLDPVAEANAFIAKVQAEKAARQPAKRETREGFSRSGKWLIDLPDAPSVHDTDKRSTAPLNGNRGFSLLR